MEEEGRVIIVMPDIQDDDAANEIFRKLENVGVDEVWVSYTLPFLVFILIGYVLTIVVGDLALFFLTRFLTRL
jgi:prepilin signal peptidase PulO-like enzyme (type II secretory pathway)